MTVETLPRRRKPGAEDEQRRRARAIVAPYVKRMEGWQVQAARLRALATAERTTEDERVEAKVAIGELRNDVLATIDDLTKALNGTPPFNRVVDVLTALRRLEEQLRDALV